MMSVRFRSTSEAPGVSVVPTIVALLRTQLGGWLLICAVLAQSVLAGTTHTPQELEFFEKKIRPILIDKCYPCHSTAEKVKGGFNLETREDLLQGGDTGPALVAGDPDKSRLIEAVRYKNLDLQMPPKNPLAAEQIRDLEAWVKMGAPDPREKAGKTSPTKRVIDLNEGRKFWAFQPVAHPTQPSVRQSAWVQSPVDAFILAKLEQQQITRPRRRSTRIDPPRDL